MRELCLVTTSGDSTAINKYSLDNFRRRLRGDLLRANDQGYDNSRRVWNALIDHRPALVVRAQALRTLPPPSGSEAITTFLSRSKAVATASAARRYVMAGLWSTFRP